MNWTGDLVVWTLFLMLVGIFIGIYWRYLQSVGKEIDERQSNKQIDEVDDR